MSVAIARVVVACPNCNQQFEDWWRPMTDPAIHVSPDMLEQSLPSECPNCQHHLEWDELEERDGIFQR